MHARIKKSDRDETDTIAYRLGELMRKKGINQAVIVKHLDVSRGTVSKWLSDDAVPRTNYQHALADFLNTSFAWLAYGEGSPDKPTVVASTKEPDDWVAHNPLSLEEGLLPLTNEHVHQLINKTSQKPVFRLESLLKPKTADEVEIPLFKVLYPSNKYIQSAYANNEKLSSKSFLIKTPKNILVKRNFIARANAISDHGFAYKNDSDSMYPRITNNALCVVDTTKKQIRDGKVYAIRHGILIKTKYLQRNPDGSLLILSHNKDYPDELVPVSELDTVEVLGWVYMTHNTDTY